MTKETLVKRIQELTVAVQQSLQNHQQLKTTLDNATSSHNALVGRLDEATYQYQQLEKEESDKPINESVIGKNK
jgi:23S rRNA maturation-related 3'-5' exoribonuclease YhaM